MLEAIEGFPLTTESYTASWRLLNERFRNEQIIILRQMNKISPVYSPSVRSFTKLLHNTESNVRELENLGDSYEQLSLLLLPAMMTL